MSCGLKTVYCYLPNSKSRPTAMKSKYLCEIERLGSLHYFHSIDGAAESIDLLVWVPNHDTSLGLLLKYICHGCTHAPARLVAQVNKHSITQNL